MSILLWHDFCFSHITCCRSSRCNCSPWCYFVVSVITLLAAVADVLAAVAGIPTVAGVPGIADAVLLFRPGETGVPVNVLLMLAVDDIHTLASHAGCQRPYFSGSPAVANYSTAGVPLVAGYPAIAIVLSFSRPYCCWRPCWCQTGLPAVAGVPTLVGVKIKTFQTIGLLIFSFAIGPPDN